MIRFFTYLIVILLNSFPIDSFIQRDFIQINVGQRIRLTCELNNSIVDEHRKGLWLRLEDAEVFFYGTNRISSNLRFQIDERTHLEIFNQSFSSEILIYSLIIDQVEISDEGTYSCQADNRIVKLFSLNLVERPTFVVDQSNLLFRRQLGDELRIDCFARGKPRPSISWRKKINESHRIYLVNCSTTTSNCSLNFSELHPNHHGIYECLATNPHGTIGRFYQIDVQFRPSVKIDDETIYSSIDDEIQLNCFIDGNPRPDIRWFHRFSPPDDDHREDEMDFSTNFHSINFEQLNSTRWKTSLLINRVASSLFSSILICRAENSLGISQRSFRILQKNSSSFRFVSLINIFLSIYFNWIELP